GLGELNLPAIWVDDHRATSTLARRGRLDGASAPLDGCENDVQVLYAKADSFVPDGDGSHGGVELDDSVTDLRGVVNGAASVPLFNDLEPDCAVELPSPLDRRGSKDQKG